MFCLAFCITRVWASRPLSRRAVALHHLVVRERWLKEGPNPMVKGLTTSRQLTRRDRGAPEQIKILCFSWNVGNACPAEEELKEWLPDVNGIREWDLIVVGTQENSVKVSDKKAKRLSESSTSDVKDDDEPAPIEGAGQGARERFTALVNALPAANPQELVPLLGADLAAQAHNELVAHVLEASSSPAFARPSSGKKGAAARRRPD